MILLDMSQVILGNVFGYTRDISEVDENVVRHMTLNSLRMYKNKFGKKYGDMVLVFDSCDYWRKAEFPHYKGTRKLKQNQDKDLWSNLWNIISMIRDELEDNFPYKVMRVGRAEADDVIAYLTKKHYKREGIMIISSDKDFQQLQRYENVNQYSPKNKSNVVCSNPKEFLIEHIIRGDSSDGIPNILSDDDTLMNEEKRQKPITKKVIETINEDLAFGELPKGFEDNWKRNQTLVDLDKVPDWINEKIEGRWSEPIKGKRNQIFNYFIKHKLRNLMETIEEF
jgi:hypothetical protein